MGAPLGPIQVLPRGLTGLLQLKTLGRVPDELAGFVQPAMDIGAYYLAAAALVDVVIHGINIGPGAAGPSPFSPGNIVVPNDEVWYVHQYSVEVLLPVGAAEAARNVQPIMYLTSVGTIRWVGLTEQSITVTGNAAAARGGVITARDFWAPPGAQLGFYSGGTESASTIAFNGQVYKTAMKV